MVGKKIMRNSLKSQEHLDTIVTGNIRTEIFEHAI